MGELVTVGSVSRQDAEKQFPFLAQKYRGRRKAIKNFTHQCPDFVFWIYPYGQLFDAKDAHRLNTPKGYEWILSDEPDYGGFLRGRLASNYGPQLLVIYCRSEALTTKNQAVRQLVRGLSGCPVPISNDALVVSDNGDIYGTIVDLQHRAASTDC